MATMEAGGYLPPGFDVSSHRLTLRAFLAGSFLAIFLCGVNSYLTLSFGIIEEGPTIAALFFFAMFFLAKKKITNTELVIVATMGSAGGSLGFISNFFAAKLMTGSGYTFWEMTLFSVVTSLVGIMFVIPLRELLVIREKLPWPGSRATAGIIGALSEHGDKRQPAFLLASLVFGIAYVLLNTDGGFGVVPDSTAIGLFGLASLSAGIAWSPFAFGAAYLMGLRTCVGFLVGGIALLVMAPHLADPAVPHRYVWPGIAFLVSSGLTVMAVNWKVISGAMRSLMSRKGADKAVDDDPVLKPRSFVMLTVGAFLAAVLFLWLGLGIGVGLVVVLIVIGGFIQNVIATRAAAVTAFNPARVMGVMLQGVCALLGGASTQVNLTGAGFVAGSGAQAGNLTGDMAYGRWFRVPSRWQFWTQFTTMLPCSLVSAWVFMQIRNTQPLTLEGEGLPAPVAKIWAASALVFNGTSPMPPGATTAMLIAAALGVVWVLLESREGIARNLPSSIGFGLGLILPVSYDFAFFLGGVIFWLGLQRGLKVSDLTLSTIAVGFIVAEGLGGVAKPVLQMLGVL